MNFVLIGIVAVLMGTAILLLAIHADKLERRIQRLECKLDSARVQMMTCVLPDGQAHTHSAFIDFDKPKRTNS